MNSSSLNNLYFEVLREGLKYVETIIAVGVEKSLFRETYAMNLPKDDFRTKVVESSFRSLIERILWWNYDNGCTDYLLLILDDQSFGKLRGQERAYRDFIISEMKSGFYISKLPCKKLFPIAAFADSSQTKLLQLADLVTWVIRRVLWRPSHAFLDIPNLWKIIKHKLRKKNNKMLGYGFKPIPDIFKVDLF